ncbi:hypothetical protein [Pararhodobacter sp.]|uniref:hypothetical protein n=1 Tax=Pararhodobacter sp. TaxID=2127056 RepID=UPI002B0023F0|nr:hypothetical protein [Pararhodobacter sp.]
MAITIPRPLPDLRYVRSQMTLGRALSVNSLASGAVQAVESGAALWRLSIQTEPLRWSGRRALNAWHGSLAGTRRILGYDWLGSYPVAYGVRALGLVKAGGGVWGGTATLGAATATTLTLSGLPAGYKASAGDRLSFPWAGVRAYHEITEAVTASAAGVMTVTVEPAVRLNPAPAAGAVVALVRPACIMMIVPDSWQCDESGPLGSASFEAVQVLS